MIATTNGFAEALRIGQYVLVRRSPTGRPLPVSQQSRMLRDETFQLGEDMLHIGLGSADLDIIEVVGGEGGGGIGKVLMGVVMIAGAFITAGASMAALSTLAGTTGGITAGGMVSGLGMTAFSVAGMAVSYGQIAMFGAIMALSGVSQLLTSHKSAKRTSSLIFQGPANVSTQGSVIPLVYGGPIQVGSITIAAAITNVKGQVTTKLPESKFMTIFDPRGIGIPNNMGYLDTQNPASTTLNPADQSYPSIIPNNGTSGLVTTNPIFGGGGGLGHAGGHVNSV